MAINTWNGSQFKVLCGSAIDKYLASAGAIAQAVDRETILLGSSVFQLNSSERQLVIWHEMAHLEQLARPGSDPTTALEDEAWEAAYAWSSSKPYRIRGRANHPLNAYAIIQGGRRGHPSAPPWYTSNPVEPIGDSSTITVADSVVLEEMTLESIMDSIIQKKDKDVIIVCHGLAEGLLIPFVANISSLNVMQEPVARIAADHSGTVDGINLPVYKDADVAHQLSEEMVKRLRAKMNTIRGLKLNHVAFRACNMGEKADTTLSSFKDMFGSASVSAPKLEDSYGKFSVSMGGNLNTWAAKKRKNEGFRVWIDNGVAFGVKVWEKDSTQFQIICKASDSKALAAWAKAHITDAALDPDNIVFHGMNELFYKVPDQSSPVVYFIRDKSFIDNIVNYKG